jgi:hypothetical protein
MQIDDKVVIKASSDEMMTWVVKVAEEAPPPVQEAPPIPLWEVGAVLLSLIGGGAGAYYLVKRGKK